jgi:hypothetical protein
MVDAGGTLVVCIKTTNQRYSDTKDLLWEAFSFEKVRPGE